MESKNSRVGQSAVLNATSHPLAQLGSLLSTADQKLYQTVRTTHGWMKKEWQAPPTGLPPTRELDMWRRGLFPRAGTIFHPPPDETRDYLSDYQHYVRCSRINAWNGFYGHKMVLRSFLLAIGLRQANTVALVLDG